MSKGNVFFVSAALLLIAGTAHAASRRLIGEQSVSTNGCNETSQTFVTSIQGSQDLNFDYNGRLAGIEVREDGMSAHWMSGMSFINNGSAIQYTLHAKGAGTRINNPFNGGSVCVGAHTGSEHVWIYAHYK